MATKKAATAMANEAEAQEAAERSAMLAERNYVMQDAEWDSLETPEFGGQSDIMVLDIGEAAGPFTYIGSQPMTTELGETTVHTATTPVGETIRLPISATFVRSIDQAGVKRGDVFAVRRWENVIKKSGKGKGQPMPVYSVKVITRPVTGQ